MSNIKKKPKHFKSIFICNIYCDIQDISPDTVLLLPQWVQSSATPPLSQTPAWASGERAGGEVFGKNNMFPRAIPHNHHLTSKTKNKC